MAKTREEYQAKLVELRELAESKTREYNDAAQNGEMDKATKTEAEIEEAISEYTGIAEMLAFDTCEKSENPMVTAVTMLTFRTIAKKDVNPETIEVKDVNGKTFRLPGRPIFRIVDKEKYIDLAKLHKRITGGIGADKTWIYQVEKMNMCMTAQRAQDLGCSAENLKDINDSYAMSEIAKQVQLGKNPCSNTQLLKTLTAIVAAMLGEGYKPNSHDVAFLKSVYAKKGKAALSVACANHKNFRNYIAEVCHRIVTGGIYTVEFKKAK